jgi:sensor histidine kinase YesM
MRRSWSETIDRLGALRLRTQLLITFVLISFITIAMGSLFFYSSMLSTLQKRSEERTIASFKQVEYSMNAFRSKVESVTKSFLLDPAFDKFLAHRYTLDMDELEMILAMKSRMSEVLYSNPMIHSIYLFTEDGRMSAYNEHHFLYRKDLLDHWFYTSPVRMDAALSSPKLAWNGGIHSSDFNRAFQFNEEIVNDDRVLSVSLRIGDARDEQKRGTLVLNIYEQENFEVYRNLTNGLTSLVYVLDENGNMISGDSAVETQPKEKQQLFQQMTNQTGSFTNQNRTNNEVQVIYYKMPESGWTICMEIPMSEYKFDINQMRKTIVYIALISLAVAMLSAYIWTRKLTRPIYTLLKGMRTLEQWHLGTSIHDIPKNELGILINEFNKMSVSMRRMVEQHQRIEMEKRRAELEVLQAQINPHFLFNTLNTIKWMAIAAQAGPIISSITALGSLIRPIFKETAMIIPLQEELVYVRHYMTIMNNRYGEAAKLSIQMDEALGEATVPRFILQPLIENSLLHGLESRQYQGTITIITSAEQSDMLIRIQDDGVGIEPAKLEALKEMLLRSEREQSQGERKQIGLQNVHRRIQMHYGDQYGLSIEEAHPSGTAIKLKLPLFNKS